MRDYLSPARRVLARAIPHPAAIKAFIIKRRAFVFIMAATFVVITTLGYVSARAITASNSKDENVVEAKGQTSTFSNVTESQQPASTGEATVEGDNSQATASTPSSNSESKTTVTVNNEQIEVPQNGTVQRTVTNGDGSTSVSVTTNTSSNNSSTTNSHTSTNTNSTTSSNVFSHEMNISH